MELRSLANGAPFLYSDFKFNLNTKNKVFPVPVSVCCPFNLFNLSIDAFNGPLGSVLLVIFWMSFLFLINVLMVVKS